MSEYTGIAEATRDVRTKVNESDIVNHPLSSPALAVVVPTWTEALSGFQAGATVSVSEARFLEQIDMLYERSKSWLVRTARDLNIRTLNEHGPDRVLFMGLFRDLQLRFAEKQNLNPHKLAVLFDGRYTIKS
jgi:hypothetical protein